MNFTPVCTLGGPNDTVDIVLRAFATIWWDTPRKVKNIIVGEKPLTATFQLVNGWRTYQIAPTTSPTHVHAYQISVSGIADGTKYDK